MHNGEDVLALNVKRIIDLSVTISTFMPAGALAPLPELRPVAILCKEGYNAENYSSSTHTGTHFDAPYHFSETGETIDRLDLNLLIGDGFCIPVSPAGREIGASDLSLKWRSEFDGKIILLNTGWSKKRGFTKEFYYDYPGLDIDAAEFLVKHGVRIIGIDSLGMEPSGKTIVHKTLLERGTVFIEDLANLDELEAMKRYFIVSLPLKLKNASGAMARVVALDVY